MIINMVGGGGGAALNFKVVPGLTQPGTASENTIWVKTEQIGAWYFSATQPENMQEWDVWFHTGVESHMEFNALKKNAVQVYPLSAKQYVSGAIVDVEAEIYQGGEWVDLITYLYKPGDLCEELTGGWEFKLGSEKAEYLNTAAKGSSMETGLACARTKNKIDFKNKKWLKVSLSTHGSTAQSSVAIVISSSTATSSTSDGSVAKENPPKVETKNEYAMDVSGIDGSYYVKLFSYLCENRWYKVWLE